jgi:hypothetical protein
MTTHCQNCNGPVIETCEGDYATTSATPCDRCLALSVKSEFKKWSPLELASRQNQNSARLQSIVAAADVKGLGQLPQQRLSA